jgi:V-type H+-transporting ATPase subunit F
LAGVGHRTAEGSNFLIVKADTKLQQIEEAFEAFSTRDDVGIILINQHVAKDIRHVLKSYTSTIPTVLEIPSKEHPYDPEQDYIMVSSVCIGSEKFNHANRQPPDQPSFSLPLQQRVNMFLGGGL